jgi:hypothetical protein
MTKGELLQARAAAPGLIRLKDGRMYYGLITAYDTDAPDGATIELTPVQGEPLRIRVDDIDAE